MTYTPPSGDAANFSWVGVAAYTPPLGDAANFSWQGVTGSGVGALEFSGNAVAVHGVSGAAVGELAFAGAAAGDHQGNAITGEGSGELVLAGAGTGSHGVAGVGVGAFALHGGGSGAHGVSGVAGGALGFVGAAVAQHLRYELRGEVRLGGVLVNRRVRVYSRNTGALLGQADTVAGLFQVHAGFAEAECYATPIDLDSGATDWRPPTVNRVTSVLANDAA